MEVTVGPGARNRQRREHRLSHVIYRANYPEQPQITMSPIEVPGDLVCPLCLEEIMNHVKTIHQRVSPLPRIQFCDGGGPQSRSRDRADPPCQPPRGRGRSGGCTGQGTEDGTGEARSQPPAKESETKSRLVKTIRVGLEVCLPRQVRLSSLRILTDHPRRDCRERIEAHQGSGSPDPENSRHSGKSG